MAKSRAEINKAYRNKKKASHGEAYMSTERQRVKKYFIPAAELSASKRKAKNAKKAESMRKLRAKRKQLKLSPLKLHRDFLTPNLSAGSSSSSKAAGPRSRKRKTIAYQRRVIHALTEKVSTSDKKYNAMAKKYSRLRSKVTNNSSQIQDSPKTPRSKAQRDIERDGIEPDRVPTIRRNLVNSYALLDEIKSASDTRKNKAKPTLTAIVGGKIVKKYRCASALSRHLGISRKALTKSSGISKNFDMANFHKWRLPKERKQIKNLVESFLLRDDNSRVSPGKADVTKTSEGHKAKRMLSDYLYNLHKKFLAENPSLKLSLTSFQRLRPSYVTTASFLTKQSCLCMKHQNFALLLKALKPYTQMVTTHTDNFIRSSPDVDAIFDDIGSIDKITYFVWKQVEVENGGKRTRMVEDNLKKEDFKKKFEKAVNDFQVHLDLVEQQYAAVKKLKESVPQEQLVIQMDFSENFTPRYAQEVQSAYWNSVGITLHPCVAYFKKEDGSLDHSSFVIVSDDPSHTKMQVFSFMKALMSKAKDLTGQPLQYVHYVTDSPTSQYRNRFIFYVIQMHEEIFGVPCSWTYFEAGHGKGPCDGVGAVVKRMADDHIKQGKVIIQDAKDFFKWGSQQQGAIKYVFVSQEEVKESSKVLDVQLKSVPDTMKMHAVIALPDGFAVRKSSCFCASCFNDSIPTPSCDGWVIHSLKPAPVVEASSSTSRRDLQRKKTNNDRDLPCLPAVKSFVAAVYEENWYVGEVTEVDVQENEVYVKFMEKAKGLYRWPKHDDVLWLRLQDVLLEIPNPMPTGKSARLYCLDEAVTENIVQKFNTIV